MANRMFVLVGEKGAKEASEVAEVFRQFNDVTFHIAIGGDEVIQYLQGEGRFTDRNAYPFPSWMILNMRMPGLPGPRRHQMAARKSRMQRRPRHFHVRDLRTPGNQTSLRTGRLHRLQKTRQHRRGQKTFCHGQTLLGDGCRTRPRDDPQMPMTTIDLPHPLHVCDN